MEGSGDTWNEVWGSSGFACLFCMRLERCGRFSRVRVTLVIKVNVRKHYAFYFAEKFSGKEKHQTDR